MSKIYDNLYLGNITISRDNVFFKNNKIKYVLVAAKNLKRSFVSTCIYHQLDISDNPTTIILKYWPESIEFLHKIEGNVLVHCQGGKSRSASTVMAYVMFKEDISSDESINKVRKCHKFAYPNAGFLKQLEYWEEILKEYRQKVPLNSGKEDYQLLNELTSHKLNEVTSSILTPNQEDLRIANQKLNFIDILDESNQKKKSFKPKKQEKNGLANENKIISEKSSKTLNNKNDNSKDRDAQNSLDGDEEDYDENEYDKNLNIRNEQNNNENEEEEEEEKKCN